MKKSKTLITMIAIILVIALYSLFHSYVNSITYFQSLNHILSVVITELWKFISTPTIFIALVVSVLLWAFRENILSVFPAIKEIRAGSFSATIEYPQKTPSISEIIESEITIDVPDKDNLEAYAQTILLSRVSDNKKMLRLLLDIDGQVLSIKEFTEKMKAFGIRERITSKYLHDDIGSVYYFYYGMIISYIDFLSPYVLDQKISEDTLRAYLTLQEGVREKIEKLLHSDSEIKRSIES